MPSVTGDQVNGVQPEPKLKPVTGLPSASQATMTSPGWTPAGALIDAWVALEVIEACDAARKAMGEAAAPPGVALVSADRADVPFELAAVIW